MPSRRHALLIATSALLPIGTLPAIAAGRGLSLGSQFQGGSATISTSGSTIRIGGAPVSHDFGRRPPTVGRFGSPSPGVRPITGAHVGGMTAASSGFGALVAPGARGSSTITAKLGRVGLPASSKEFTLDFYGDELITLGVDHRVGSKLFDEATGKPLSRIAGDRAPGDNGRQVELSAAAARIVVNSAINGSRAIEATAIGQRKGAITLGTGSASSTPRGTAKPATGSSGTTFAAASRTRTKSGVTSAGSGNASTAASLPQGPKVVSGSATITTSGSTLTITQTTTSAVINWNTLNIPPGESLVITMPSASSVEIDRVTGGHMV